ncbi:hypothetical protein GGR10_001155 [Bartonella chomelii]|uniref:Uncharacterized protein n=1 Tax=Bartonella chomelii TaxID=236402 RepID=A0ABR6E417_9HYPH|nr:hypothetical protein [Bartonella chomelii]
MFYTGLMDINNQTELLGTMVTSFDPFLNGKPEHTSIINLEETCTVYFWVPLYA